MLHAGCIGRHAKDVNTTREYAICGSNIMQQEDVYQSIRKMIRSGIPHVSFTPSITSQDLCYVQDLTPVALMAWIPPEPWTPGEPSGQQEKGPVVGHGCDPNN